MIELLQKIFIKDDMPEDKQRGMIGQLCAGAGIFLNVMLFVFKLIAGLLSGSIAITADAMNNLSDAGSSVMSMVGFKLAGQKPDHEHPYGHGRMEYIAGLVVSGLIIVVAVQLLRDSIAKLLAPEPVVFSLVAVVVLIASILVKCYMAFYNRKYSKIIDSTTLSAVAKDSLSDCIATTVVLITMFIQHYTGFNADGIAGIGVGLFILMAGVSAAKDTINPLLGLQPDDEFIEAIENYVVDFNPLILGAHDIMVHDYGPNLKIISLHAEVPAEGDILETHDVIDNLEYFLGENFKCLATIHMDPVVTSDPRVAELKEKVIALLPEIDDTLSIHDFRVVFGKTHTNLIYDVVIPYKCGLDDKYVTETLFGLVWKKIGENYFSVIHVDRT